MSRKLTARVPLSQFEAPFYEFTRKPRPPVKEPSPEDPPEPVVTLRYVQNVGEVIVELNVAGASTPLLRLMVKGGVITEMNASDYDSLPFNPAPFLFGVAEYLKGEDIGVTDTGAFEDFIMAKWGRHFKGPEGEPDEGASQVVVVGDTESGTGLPPGDPQERIDAAVIAGTAPYLEPKVYGPTLGRAWKDLPSSWHWADVPKDAVPPPSLEEARCDSCGALHKAAPYSWTCPACGAKNGGKRGRALCFLDIENDRDGAQEIREVCAAVFYHQDLIDWADKGSPSLHISPRAFYYWTREMGDNWRPSFLSWLREVRRTEGRFSFSGFCAFYDLLKLSLDLTFSLTELAGAAPVDLYSMGWPHRPPESGSLESFSKAFEVSLPEPLSFHSATGDVFACMALYPRLWRASTLLSFPCKGCHGSGLSLLSAEPGGADMTPTEALARGEECGLCKGEGYESAYRHTMSE